MHVLESKHKQVRGWRACIATVGAWGLLLASLAGSCLMGALPPAPPALAPGEWVDLGGGRPQAVGNMGERRQDASLAKVGERLLVTGGSAQATSEWFDVSTRAFTPGPPLAHPRAGHRTVALPGGGVLLLGGTEPARPPEVWKPSQPRFQPLAGDARFSVGAEGVGLGDGRILMVDGQSGKAWVWDGEKAPREVGRLAQPRVFFRMTLLEDGTVLVSGGLPAGRGKDALPLEVFRPKSGRWSTLKATVAARARHQATRLPNGQVLLWAGTGLDAAVMATPLEVVDVAKDHVKTVGQLHQGWGSVPGVAFQGTGTLVIHPDRAAHVVKLPLGDLDTALTAAPRNPLPLANRYQEAQVVLATEQSALIMGTALSGPSLERWDPRTRHAQPWGVLRPGAEGVVLLPDKRILSVGPVVDQVDPKTGQLLPLGWREDLQALLKKAKAPEQPGKAFKTFPKGQERREHCLVALDKNRVLVVGGRLSETEAPSKFLGIWEGTQKRITPAGSLDAPRCFTGKAGEGALKLADGSVLIWGGMAE